jgi:hypothetical protein
MPTQTWKTLSLTKTSDKQGGDLGPGGAPVGAIPPMAVDTTTVSVCVSVCACTSQGL